MSKPDKRIEILKLDGTDLFTQGDISGATGLYITAMQLDTDRAMKDLTTSPNISTDMTDHKGVLDTLSCTENEVKDNKGIYKVIEDVLKEADEAIQVNPSQPKPYLSKATALVLQNKWDEAKKALQKLHKTQSLLKSIPSVIQRTSSISSDMSVNMGPDIKSSPQMKNRRFRMQHRKKLSRPQSDVVMTTNPELFQSRDNSKTISQENNTGTM